MNSVHSNVCWHGLRTPNEGINQIYKSEHFWLNVADKYTSGRVTKDLGVGVILGRILLRGLIQVTHSMMTMTLTFERMGSSNPKSEN